MFDLPPEAIEWLCDMFAVIQLFDDVADGDTIERKDLNRVIWASLVGMQNNTFYAKNSQTLLPVVATQILKWQGSDIAERSGEADERSYVWRAGYYDLIMLVYFLCHGREKAELEAVNIMKFYGETFKEYKKEFSNA
ncbi:MAG: hypothetical protein JKY11_06040 [Alphaproteobacteria bacterium]|nr:hypothetical protein [Alphaproteobacteria bacterium]